MGWWKQDTEGLSFALDERSDSELRWGDAPADIMGSALVRIFAEFQEAYRRKPTEAELKAGLMFSARPLLADEVTQRV